MTTFTLPGQYAGGITSGPDGNLWFLGDGVARMTTAGEITNFATSGRAVELTPGLDGNMWFDEGEGGEMIGKIGTGGSSPVTNPGSGGTTASSTSSGSPAAKKSNSGAAGVVSIAKTKLELKKGVARLSVTFPGPGKLVVSGKGIKGVTERIKKAGKAAVTIKPTTKTLSTLKSKGKVSLPIKLTFTPTGSKAHTVSATLKLED